MDINNPEFLKILNLANMSIWVDNYAKASWIFGGSVYFITGNIECGKAYTLISILIAFLLTFHYLSMKGKRIQFCIIFSVIAALNPVAVAQKFSFYNDGYLHMMLYIMILSLTMMIDSKYPLPKTIPTALAASAMIICANIKFTGLLYGGIYCIAYFILENIYRYKKEPVGYKREITISLIKYMILAMTCVFWAGLPTYVINTIRHGNPTYPLSGDNSVDIMTGNSPKTLLGHNRFYNLFASLFSRLSNINSEEKIQLKFPFTLYRSEIHLMGADSRQSGYGVFFSGLLCISIIVLIVYIINSLRKHRSEMFPFVIMHCTLTVLLCTIIEQSWWARYSPYIYFLFLIGFYILLEMTYQNPNKNAIEGVPTIGKSIRYKKILISFLLIAFLINIIPCATTTPSRVTETKNSFLDMKTNGLSELYLGNFPGVYFNLVDNDVDTQNVAFYSIHSGNNLETGKDVKTTYVGIQYIN